MTADSFTAQNQIKEFNPDSTTHSSGEPVIECDPSLPDTTSKEGEVQDPIVSSSESEVVYTSDTEEEDIYITASEDEDTPSDPRLELVDKQFNLKMKPAATNPVHIQCTHCSSHYIFSAHYSHVQLSAANLQCTLQPSTTIYNHLHCSYTIQCTLQPYYPVHTAAILSSAHCSYTIYTVHPVHH